MKIEFIYICAALGAVLLIISCVFYYQHALVIAASNIIGTQSQNPTHTIRPSNQSVRTVTGNAQPMTWIFPAQRYSSQSLIPLLWPTTSI